MPPSLAISSFSNPYIILCLAGCIFDLNSSEVTSTLDGAMSGLEDTLGKVGQLIPEMRLL